MNAYLKYIIIAMCAIMIIISIFSSIRFKQIIASGSTENNDKSMVKKLVFWPILLAVLITVSTIYLFIAG